MLSIASERYDLSSRMTWDWAVEEGQMSAKSLSFSLLPGCNSHQTSLKTTKKKMVLLYKGILSHLVKREMKRCAKITNNLRAIIQLPDDLWRWVAGLSCAFQVKSSFISSLCYFGPTLKWLKGRPQSRALVFAVTDSEAVAPTWPWGLRGYSHLTPWAPPSSPFLGGRNHSTCSCLHR